MDEFIDRATDRILLITGDLVDDPTPKAFAEAKQALAAFRATKCFTDIRAVAGNHDVKRLGLFVAREDAYAELRLPKTSESIYYPSSGLDLVLLDSNDASFAKGKINQASYNSMVAGSAELTARLKQEVKARERNDPEPVGSIIRILALHHHPLPQATGEGKRVLGVADEPLMYLASPATFLEAAISLDTNLILHGHRHVEGLTRYSIPNPLATTSENSDEFWRTVYVLSCPSSTGHGGDEAGFNIIHFGPTYGYRRVQYRFEVTRYSRRSNVGAFQPIDACAKGIVHLPAGHDNYRDPAVQVAIELRPLVELKRTQAIAFATQLLTRRAFYEQIEQSWAHALYTYLVTYTVWEDLLNKFSRGLARDREALSKIRLLLNELVSLCATVLGIGGAELDELRYRPLLDQRQIMDDWPRHHRSGISESDLQKSRLAILKEINEALSDLGVQIDLGGRPPSRPQSGEHRSV
jgi:hypothetical protein